MLRPTPTLKVYVYTGPVDMRKSIDGLSILVEESLNLSPFESALFVFCNRNRDKIKCLLWERNGFIVWYKRLEKQRFYWPSLTDEPSALTLTGKELNYLLDGFDIFHNKPHETLHYESVY